jgi:hypothetical protein
VLVGQPFIVTADFLYNAMRAHAEWALGVMVTQASLVEAVFAHEVDAGKVQWTTALRALWGVEQARLVWI